MTDTQELFLPTEEKVRTSEMRIHTFNVFSETFKPTLNTIYYPGSNTDISPSKTPSFKASRIIYVDTDGNAIQALQKQEFEAYAEDAKEFNPGKVDLVLLLNFYEEKPLKYVDKNGYAICNDHWTGTLRKMLGKNDFELAGLFIDGSQTLRTDPETLGEEKLRISTQIFDPNRSMANLFVFRKK